jgi:hypothetical protein
MLKRLALSLAVLAASASLLAQAPAPAAPQVRLRAVIEKIDASSITIKERSGEVITLVRPAAMDVSEVYPIAMADIKAGSYIGTAAMPQADGTQLALEVLVFPEAARGAGEGHRPWDLRPDSTMTNATVADLTAAPSSVPGGQKLTLKYKDGEKVVIVPAGVPVVSFKPGKQDEAALLVPGARVLITAQERDGKPTALRVLVGRNGFAPPM